MNAKLNMPNHTFNNITSQYAPGDHRIERFGLGYSRPLTNEEIARVAPAIFAEEAHDSRSPRYAYIPTVQLLDGMRKEGFWPVHVTQAIARNEDKRGFTKHLIRFRRDDQMMAPEAREVVLVNSHDGSSGFQLMDGLFRRVCANGLITGSYDREIRVRHSGKALDNVIEGAYTVVKNFDAVTESIEGMKALTLKPEAQEAFAKAAIAVRFADPDSAGVHPQQVLRIKRQEDVGNDLWSVFNRAQENLVKGGIATLKKDAHNRSRRGHTRELKGIDQNVAVNRGLWVLAEEMKKLAA